MIARLCNTVDAHIDVMAQRLVGVFEDMTVLDTQFPKVVELCLRYESVDSRLDIVASNYDVDIDDRFGDKARH